MGRLGEAKQLLLKIIKTEKNYKLGQMNQRVSGYGFLAWLILILGGKILSLKVEWSKPFQGFSVSLAESNDYIWLLLLCMGFLVVCMVLLYYLSYKNYIDKDDI